MEARYVLKFEADPFRLQKTQDSMSKIPAGLIKVLIADEHLPESWRARAREMNIQILPLQPTALGVVRVARRMLAAHKTTTPDRALVIYPREAEAVRLWRLRHGTP